MVTTSSSQPEEHGSQTEGEQSPEGAAYSFHRLHKRCFRSRRITGHISVTQTHAITCADVHSIFYENRLRDVQSACSPCSKQVYAMRTHREVPESRQQEDQSGTEGKINSTVCHVNFCKSLQEFVSDLGIRLKRPCTIERLLLYNTKLHQLLSQNSATIIDI